MGDPEFDGVTLMLSDDNLGSLRSLSKGIMKRHRNGFGPDAWLTRQFAAGGL